MFACSIFVYSWCAVDPYQGKLCERVKNTGQLLSITSNGCTCCAQIYEALLQLKRVQLVLRSVVPSSSQHARPPVNKLHRFTAYRQLLKTRHVLVLKCVATLYKCAYKCIHALQTTSPSNSIRVFHHTVNVRETYSRSSTTAHNNTTPTDDQRQRVRVYGGTMCAIYKTHTRTKAHARRHKHKVCTHACTYVAWSAACRLGHHQHNSSSSSTTVWVCCVKYPVKKMCAYPKHIDRPHHYHNLITSTTNHPNCHRPTDSDQTTVRPNNRPTKPSSQHQPTNETKPTEQRATNAYNARPPLPPLPLIKRTFRAVRSVCRTDHMSTQARLTIQFGCIHL